MPTFKNSKFMYTKYIQSWLLPALTVCTLMLQAQTPTQTIRGMVADADNNQPLVGATVALLETTYGTVTDSVGTYRLQNVPVGRYQLHVSYVGKESVSVPILVESGREFVQTVELHTNPANLETVIVKAPKNRVVHPVSTKTITVEETLRFPATFYDPARLATTFAGVVNDNDQANGIAIRGNSPNGLSWRLEGVEIVNPNHTPNAGTFSDRVTINGGGTNILSAQLLDNSFFLTGAFPAQYGNVLSGVLDMRLRKGNDERHEFIGQIGLIGIDVAAEGPLSRSSKASYLVNYRYSTVGLLTSLGLDFGDEEIAFQDLSFNLTFPTQTAGTFTVFGVGGISENIFEAQRDTTEWEFQKDRYDINFKSKTGILGATHTLSLGDRNLWQTSFATSALESTRTGNLLDAAFVPTTVERDEYIQSKTSFTSSFSHRLNETNRLRVGIFVTQHRNNITSIDDLTENIAVGKGDGILLQPYFNWRSNLTPRLTLNAGLHYLHFTFNETQALEPRLALNYTLGSGQQLSLAYGLHSQLQLPQLYFAEIAGGNPNKDLGFTKSHHIVVGYENPLSASTILSVEAYYQALFDVPIIDNPTSSFSALNLLEGFVSEPLVNEGTGKNYGLEVSIQKNLTNDVYFLGNASLYESKYTGGDGIERNTRFNGNYIFNLTGGKEWKWNRENRRMIMGVNARAAVLGGFRDTPIDAEKSAEEDETVYINSEAFTLKQQDYFKIDLRVYYKKNKPHRTTTWALDIQNLTNQQNVAFHYFDQGKGEIVTKYQLGLIPILTYRIEL